MESLKSFDWQAALETSLNKKELARELVAMFAKDLPGFHSRINEACNKQDYSALIHALHKLNGACCYCGVPRLRKIVDDFEKTLKNNPKTNTQNFLDAFNQEVKKLLTILKNENLC